MLKEGQRLPCALFCRFDRNCRHEINFHDNKVCIKNIQAALGPPSILVDANREGTTDVFESGSDHTPRMVINKGRVLKINYKP